MTEEFSVARGGYRALDHIDTILVATLQEEGRLRLEDLARRVELSPSTVHDRLRRLQRDGVIRKWTIAVNPQALNLTVLAFVGIRASRPCSELVEPLARIHEIEEAHSVDGRLSLMVKVRATSTEHLLHIIDQLKRIPGVETTETTVVLKTYLERGPRPAPQHVETKAP
jgi:Lrp/AsnC family transcriptional regulator, leucine-responsive regulatory protein